MAWLARLDTRARRWPRLARWAYTGLKFYLLAAGTFLWIMLWWERHWFLGLAQAVCVGVVLFRELRGE